MVPIPSLNQYALTLASGSLAPIGQHAVSMTYDEGLLLLDNGLASRFQDPPGETRTYTSARKYQLDLSAGTATEVWNYEMDQSVYSIICGSAYEDAPNNYLVDYAYEDGHPTRYGRLVGLDPAGDKIFDYRYTATVCNVTFNVAPVHLENIRFPTVGPKALNLSTRGLVSDDDSTLIGGFIVTGSDSKKVALRVLGPSLSERGLTGLVADPTLTLYDASGNVFASNDDWGTDAGAAELAANGLAPAAASEAATIQTLVPAAYTVVARSKDATSGLGLVEVYDLTAETGPRLANISTRGTVASGNSVLISGFIVGEVANMTVVLRALGPSLTSANVSTPLSDPVLNIYDKNGSLIADNDNWQDDINSPDVEKNGLAPTNPAESAIVLNLPADAYTAIVSSADGSTGTALAELYSLQ